MITELPTREFEAMDHRLPLYARLADVLTKRIASGEWSPSSPLPSETTLAADYSVSIGTMRKAMQQLDEKGLLERRQGSGTYIRRARMAGPTAPSLTAAFSDARSLRPINGRKPPVVLAGQKSSSALNASVYGRTNLSLLKRSHCHCRSSLP